MIVTASQRSRRRIRQTRRLSIPPYNTGHDFIYDDDIAQTRADYEAESGEFDEDGGNRKFILVQIPEETSGEFASLCEIGEERIPRAGAKIVEEIEEANKQLKLGEEPNPIPDIGFRVLRIDSSSFRDTYLEPNELNQASIFYYIDNLVEGRSADDLLFQVLPKFRIPYSAKYVIREIAGKTVFDVKNGQLVACFDDDVDVDVIEEIAKMRPRYAVFRDASMADDATTANFEELFKTYSPDTIRRVI